MSSSSSSSSSGAGCFSVLTIMLQVLFIGLKLTGYITWTWFWVMSPLLIYCSFALSFVLLILAVAILAAWDY